MNKKQIITYSILGLFTLSILYISGVLGVLNFIFTIFLYTTIFYVFHIGWNKVRKKEYMKFKNFLNYFIYRVSILLLSLFIIIGGFAYYINEISPAEMPEYTLSNGTKTVKFQAMSHIATKEFYDQIINNLIEYKKEGGVYFYEGVKPGSQESMDKFNKAIGVKFDQDLYKNFSKLYGVTNQNNNDFIGLVNKLDFNIDMNLDEIVKYYEESKKDNKSEESKIPLDANKEIINTLSKLNERELKVLVYINQAILNFIISSDKTQSLIKDNFANTDLYEVILDKRNIVLADAIIETKYDKIYITYGLLHFDGVLDLLKSNDNNWKIISVKNLYPIKD